MREIKFRAWYNNKMVDDEEAKRLLYNNTSTSALFITELDMMQYTGLKDKNGKEIYEGDIIRSFFSDGQECIHKIGYESAEGRFTASWKLISCGINQAWINEFEKEVIGNIYENPELVKF
jgi:uncharacterized phage protein (TIGR01671 family)